MGTTRRGPRARPRPPLNLASLSPPRPTDKTRIVSTIGRQSPISVAWSLMSGRPSVTMAMSVVVPPISAMIAVWDRLRWHAPITLAAGPEITVSTGRCNAISARTKDPSPLTTINGAPMPRVPSIS